MQTRKASIHDYREILQVLIQNVPVDAVQMFMCNISTVNTTISVSAVSRQPIATTTSPEPVFWEEWSFQDYPTTVQDPLINSVSPEK